MKPQKVSSSASSTFVARSASPGSRLRMSSICEGNTFRPQRPSAQLRDYGRDDRWAVLHLLSFLPDLYPGGERWLETSLRSVDPCLRPVRLAELGGRIVGISIFKVRDSARAKLSTIWVAPEARGRRVGSLLLDDAVKRAERLALDSVTITVRDRLDPQIRPLLTRYRFHREAIESNRYGRGAHEVIWLWRKERRPLLSPPAIR